MFDIYLFNHIHFIVFILSALSGFMCHINKADYNDPDMTPAAAGVLHSRQFNSNDHLTTHTYVYIKIILDNRLY